MARSDPAQQGPTGCWVAGDEWEIHRPAIQDLYQNQNLALKEVMRIMEDRHGFRATQRMYKTRIKSWGLDKNFKESEVVELFRLRRERDRIGKPTVYMIRGREVDWERVNTYVRRKGLDIASLIDASSSSANFSLSAREISCRTPTPDLGERFTSPASTTSSLSSSSTTTAVSSPQDARTTLVSTSPYPSSPRRTSLSNPSPSQTLTLTPDRVRSFQLFLTRIYETVMFEDGDRVWGTTEYWLRNTRSQEWIMTVRVKLALYREYLQVGGPETRTFKMLNRAFAILEAMSAGIIGTRMFYLVNFFFAFSPVMAGGLPRGGNPFAPTVVQLVESVHAAGAMPPLGAVGGSDGAGVSASLRFGEGGSGEVDFRESAGRFLAKVLEQMVSTMGVALPKEAVLLLEEDADGYPVLSGERRQPGVAGGQKRDMSASEALEMALQLLSRRDDAQAEEYLVGIIDGLSTSSVKEAKALVRCANYHLSRIWRRRGDMAQAREHMRSAVEGSLFCDSFVGWDEAEFLFA